MLNRFLLSIALLVPLSSAHAQVAASASPTVDSRKAITPVDPEFRDPTNAALLYYRAMLLLPEETGKRVGEVVSGQDPSWLPDPDLSQKLIDAQDVASTLVRASKIDAADFGVEYSQGVGALLPHLGKLRTCARVLAADSRRLLQNQQPDDAADRIAALFAMSRHLTGERLLISALVSNAIHTLGCKEVDHLILSGQLTAMGKKRILEAMDRQSGPDPFGIKSSIRGERYWVVVWLRDQVNGPGGAKAFTEQILPLLANDQDASEDVKAIRAMDAQAINADLDKSEGYYSAVLEVFDLPDALERLGALEKKIKDGDFGIIAKHAAPALAKAHDQYTKSSARAREVRTRLADSFARPN